MSSIRRSIRTKSMPLYYNIKAQYVLYKYKILKYKNIILNTKAESFWITTELVLNIIKCPSAVYKRRWISICHHYIYNLNMNNCYKNLYNDIF